MKVLAALTAIALLASERIEIKDGQLPAPGSQHCIRLHASGPFTHAKVIVNQITAGELSDERDELDITGYLSLGAPNKVEVTGAVSLWAWKSPLIYIASARQIVGGMIDVTIANTTENTAQVEIGDFQFTVSPGTKSTRNIRSPGGTRIIMRAQTDGLDREFIDEADPDPIVLR